MVYKLRAKAKYSTKSNPPTAIRTKLVTKSYRFAFR